MRILFSIFVAILAFTQLAYAQENVAVLLPIIGPLTPYEKASLTKEVVDGLSTRFELKHGDEVESFVKQAFQEESKKNDCDETNCYRRIAAKYNAEKIVAFRVAFLEKNRYLVTSHLYDVPTGEMLFSQKQECAKCSIDKLVAICKDLAIKLSKTK